MEGFPSDQEHYSRISRQGTRLVLASAGLLLSSLLWVLAVILNFVGPAGLVSAGILSWTAMLLDLPGAFLLATVYLGLASRVRGRARRLRQGVAWTLVAWVGLSVYWRFGLPLVASSNLQDLFAGILGVFPGGLVLVQASPDVLEEMFAVWIAASLLFVLAHALIALDYRRSDDDDWVRGMPAYAWLLGSLVSFVGTVVIVVAVLPVLAGGILSNAFAAGAVLKLLVAPNLMISGYVTSIQLGRTVASLDRSAATA